MKLLSCTFLFLLSCTTTSEHGSQINGVIYLDHREPYLSRCKAIGTYQGASSFWGGMIGNAEARIEAIKIARIKGATHFLETDANLFDGGVKGKGYRCL